jgi:hypothetical protein
MPIAITEERPDTPDAQALIARRSPSTRAAAFGALGRSGRTPTIRLAGV